MAAPAQVHEDYGKLDECRFGIRHFFKILEHLPQLAAPNSA